MPSRADSGQQKGSIFSEEKIARSPLLPVVAALLSVFLVFRTAANRVGWGQLPTPLLIAVVWALFLWSILYYVPYTRRLTRKEAGLAGAVLTLVTMLWMLFPSSLVASCAAWVAFVAITMSRPALQSWMNRIGAVWLCVALVIVVIWSGVISLSAANNAKGTSGATALATRDNLPDIYFIVPDRFTSIDGLREFGYNPDEFVTQLQQRDFYVRENSMSSDPVVPGTKHTNTTRTLRYMASVFNGGVAVDLNIHYNDAARMVKYSSIVRELKEIGYTYYNIGSWFPETKNSPLADYNYSYKGYDIVSLVYGSELSTAVVDMSFLREIDVSGLFRFSGEASIRRAELLYQRDTLLDIARGEEHPKLVFVHLLLPHPPYVWGRDGGDMPTGLTTKEQYLEQVQFAEGFLLDIVDRLGDGIVIIQSDEGVLFTTPSDNAGLTETQWNGVLTAWRVAGVDDEELDKVAHTQILGFVKNRVASP